MIGKAVAARRPLLRVPPFPGARPASLARSADRSEFRQGSADLDACGEAMRRLKVGGDYWAAQPPLPAAPYLLVRIREASAFGPRVDDLAGEGTVLWWSGTGSGADGQIGDSVSGSCDPWHLLGGASAAVVDAGDELALLAAVAGIPVHVVGDGPFAALGAPDGAAALPQLFRTHLAEAFAYTDPFTGEPMDLAAAIALCGAWRRLIDGNRDIGGAIGFAFWKRAAVAPLLWGGEGAVRFLSHPEALRPGERLAVWKSRTAPAVLAELERTGAPLIEVEDGFIRSVGLGADCVPPLSITVDRLGAHFDPAGPSELEHLLQGGDFSEALLVRARQLRALIVASGISKYGVGGKPARRSGGDQRRVLVPGQVEDDRSVRSGGGAVSTNLELLRRARLHEPDAFILYKPHPDVEAGHRVGAIRDELCLTFADAVVRDQPISTLIADVHALHVNTSLAGFEALLRGTAVTTHGVPFYAGWGLTRDLGDVPSRRTARRTLDELVAGVLLLYPRYLDPVTGLPCPPEILIRRLAQAVSPRQGSVVRLRRWQGRWKRGWTRLREGG